MQFAFMGGSSGVRFVGWLGLYMACELRCQKLRICFLYFQTAWRTAKIPNAAKIPSVGKANCVTRFLTPLTFCWGNSRHLPRPPFSRGWSSLLKTKDFNLMLSAPASTKGNVLHSNYNFVLYRCTINIEGICFCPKLTASLNYNIYFIKHIYIHAKRARQCF